MAFSFTNTKGKTYFLHEKVRILKSGKSSSLYFFAKDVRPENSLDSVPEGYMVSESKNGLPVLKRKEV